MESQPQNPEFRNNPENFHQCLHDSNTHKLHLKGNHENYSFLVIQFILHRKTLA